MPLISFSVLTMPMPRAYQIVATEASSVGTSKPSMLTEMVPLIWQPTRTASKAPAGTVTVSVSPAMQEYVALPLPDRSCPETVCVPSTVNSCIQDEPGVTIAGSVIPEALVVIRQSAGLTIPGV